MCGALTPNDLLATVRSQLAGVDRVVLAVSGGLDSMSLMDLVARSGAPTTVTVATFDHGTGAHAKRAVELVRRVARDYPFPVQVGRASATRTTESEWRAARWHFLRGVSHGAGGAVMTAHTQDDQLETVFMRVLRGSGARGIAALYAPSAGIMRPLVWTTRFQLEQYAAGRQLRWIEDPTNTSMGHLRNRVRRELLPAITAIDPHFAGDFLSLASRAAEVRRAIDNCAAEWTRRGPQGAIEISDDVLSLADPYARACAWQAMLAAHNIIAERRGLLRLSALTERPATSWYVELPGGWNVARAAEGFLLVPSVSRDERTVELTDSLLFGRFRIERQGSEIPQTDSSWSCRLPTDSPLRVRSWDDGDRIAAGVGGRPRRIKRFFSEHHIPRIERAGWPVVVHNGEIVWVPGICRRKAAPGRPGKPDHLFVCSRVDR